MKMLKIFSGRGQCLNCQAIKHKINLEKKVELIRRKAILMHVIFCLILLSAPPIFAQEDNPYEILYSHALNCLLKTDGDCIAAFDQCISHLQKEPSDTLAGRRYVDLGTIRMRNGRFGEYSKRLFEMAHHRNKQSGMPCPIMKSQFALVQYARFMNQTDSLLHHAELALATAINCGDSTRQARAEVFVGSAYLNQSDYAEALKHFQHSESLYEKLADSSGLGGLYLDLALLYSEMHQKDKARDYTLRASKIFKSTGETMKYGVALVDLSGDFIDVHMADSALYYLKLAEPIIAEKHPRAHGYLEQNLGSAYYLLRDYPEAISHYKKGLELSAKVGDTNLDILLNNFISESYLALKDYRKAHQYALISDSISAFASKNFLRSKAMLALAESAYKIEAFDLSYNSFKKYITLTDSLFGDEKQKEIAALEQRYEAEKSRKEIAFRKQENELLAKEHAASTNRNYALAACLVLLLGFAYAFISKQRHKIRGQQASIRVRQLENEKLNQALEHKSRELTTNALYMARKNEMIKSLHDQLKPLVRETDRPDLKRVVTQLNFDAFQENNWNAFTEQFSALNPTFYKELTSRHPDLSKSELRLAALLRIGLSTKDIASMLNISEQGMKKARYRLRKKMELETTDNLEAEILKF